MQLHSQKWGRVVWSVTVTVWLLVSHPQDGSLTTRTGGLEGHGLHMSTPESLPRKKHDKATGTAQSRKQYVVTSDREATTVLTVFEDGAWELQKGILYDVTHLPCRSARYTSSR
jgi:hypothetical protein